jgi:cytoskeletal protein CcmA (bactofilin family)
MDYLEDGMTKRRVLDGLQQLPSTIARDQAYIGNLQGKENYLIQGEVRGHCDVEGVVMLAKGCRWQGNVVADTIIIRGRVDGDVTARFKLELRSTAHVSGNVNSPFIAVAEGAVVQGKISRDSMLTHFKERRTH